VLLPTQMLVHVLERQVPARMERAFATPSAEPTCLLLMAVLLWTQFPVTRAFLLHVVGGRPEESTFRLFLSLVLPVWDVSPVSAVIGLAALGAFAWWLWEAASLGSGARHLWLSQVEAYLWACRQAPRSGTRYGTACRCGRHDPRMGTSVENDCRKSSRTPRRAPAALRDHSPAALLLRARLARHLLRAAVFVSATARRRTSRSRSRTRSGIAMTGLTTRRPLHSGPPPRLDRRELPRLQPPCKPLREPAHRLRTHGPPSASTARPIP